ncbi:MarR family transcriptional regulator [Rhodothalassium salexigens]|jgi:DNA-binding MarR family transcriptional regulator|uniref:MarR family winged helix-turn-helix transcriptional regulator n=1 Tax=Rhodothalassium salexigens TaxID=1086 RepID=UPI001912B679|nr:MarR family winged helix-turn-helix transcriptional regulator [Rhodothalassium salexigens]MBK5911141.1 MarR family transcriptional regulator [Rhodothalassium salexigens]
MTVSGSARGDETRQLLHLWRGALLASVKGSGPDLSTRQMTILLTVYLEDPPHTVRGLAAELGVAKPVVTRALDTLGRRGLLKRRRDPADRRNVLVQRTVKGAVFLSEFEDLITRSRLRLDDGADAGLADFG